MNYGTNYPGDVGGGFSSSGGGDGGGSSQGYGNATPSRTPRKSYDEQTLIPVTCRMILASTSASGEEGSGSLALPDGRALHHVKLVGAVRSAENLSTNVAYEIEDGTGLIEVKQWVDDNDCSAVSEMRDQTAKEAQYLRIIGQVKDYDGKKSLVAHSVRRLQQGDELTYHFLEVVYSGESYHRAERIGGMQAPVSMHTSTPLQPQKIEGGGSLNERVLSFIKSEGVSDVGAPVSTLCEALGGSHTETQVRAAIEDLAAEGHIYSTINEDHYKFAM